MERFLQKHFRKGVIALTAFVLFTFLIKVIDVKPIGPEGSAVGFAALNGFVFRLIGQHAFFEKLTKLLGYFALLTAAGFAVVGVFQFLKEKKLSGVDNEILILGCFYVLVILAYVFFELVVINRRPVILDPEEGLEASYPSSHTVLVICIMATAPRQLGRLVQNDRIFFASKILSAVLIAVMILGRLISGVHWFTDILGGVLLSMALLYVYSGAMDVLGGELWPDTHPLSDLQLGTRVAALLGSAQGKRESGKKTAGRGGAHLK